MEQLDADEGAAALTSAPAPAGWNIAFAGSRGATGDAQRTTCGQVLAPQSLGVTHPVLPCGAKVILRSGDTQILTEVIDNALVEPGRQLEVTEALAEDARDRRDGRARMAVRDERHRLDRPPTSDVGADARLRTLDPVRGPGLYVNQQTRKGSRSRSIGVADAPHGTHLARQVRNGRGFIGRVEHPCRPRPGTG